MRERLIVAGLAALFAVTPAFAQTPPAANQPETNCTPSSAASATAAPSGGQTTGNTANAMAIEKSAILPSAGGHANSAAPTVQSEGKAMQVRPDCPPDQTRSK
jgi:hypothetical protein